MKSHNSAKPGHDEKRCADILGVRVHCESYSSLVEFIMNSIEKQEQVYCCYTNPYSVMMCQKNEEFRHATMEADRVLPDGVGLLWGSKILGQPLSDRVTGPTSMLRIMEAGLEKNLRHFFFGSSEDTLERLEQRLKEKFEGIRICGRISPPFRELTSQENEEFCHQINESKADILWVGLGAPKQECWIAKHRHLLSVGCCMAVGAAFDYHAGTVKWAPNWIRSIGMEWAYRFFQQPRRLFVRNLTSFRFLANAVYQRCLGRN